MRLAMRFVNAGLCSAAILVLLALPAQARLVTIAWENAQNPDIIGFRVYTGPSLTSMQRIGDLSVGSLSLDQNGDWTSNVNVSDTEIEYLVLTGYAADGFESDYSNHKLYNDDDRDGVANASDAFPNDPNEWSDGDGDGVGDNSDAFPNDPDEWSDRDGDGVGDNGDAYPDDSSRWEPGSEPPPDDPPQGDYQSVYRINVGGDSYEDPEGNLWVSDTGYLNGTTMIAPRSADTDGTNLDPLYETERWDPAGGEEMTFSFPVDAGTYIVRLHFAEKWSGITQPGMRVFSVRIEDQIVLQDFDVYAAAGFNTADVEQVSVAVTDGSADIEFLHGVENPMVSAIEIYSEEEAPGSGTVLGNPGRPILVNGQ